MSGLNINGTTLVRYEGDARALEIPEGITAIGHHAFFRSGRS